MDHYPRPPKHPTDRFAAAEARMADFEAEVAAVNLASLPVAEAARTTRQIDQRRQHLARVLVDAQEALVARERLDAEAAAMDPRQLAAHVSRGW